jgi:hypothetical protein
MMDDIFNLDQTLFENINESDLKDLYNLTSKVKNDCIFGSTSSKMSNRKQIRVDGVKACPSTSIFIKNKQREEKSKLQDDEILNIFPIEKKSIENPEEKKNYLKNDNITNEGIRPIKKNFYNIKETYKNFRPKEKDKEVICFSPPQSSKKEEGKEILINFKGK